MDTRVSQHRVRVQRVQQVLEQRNWHALRAEIERIDLQTEHIGVPLSFANELYDLRAHIHLVRKRLVARSGDIDGPAASTDQPAAS